ncbi:four-carbon acid sugar kinase family protein [Acidovorax sp. D2M1]|uniref:Four-carbon acid sugar kinase family protein n=1 Tax=Acidovorax benzenivorans TaxID=2987520 RepID=A0ABT5RUR0_9BURK|nr:four-carbon acid sugar kinase family protein [Acidovorax benzenivorans]MDD2177417.1 four-carbon acid sugar kinase family protein [Acidovorax benzenivorans]
MTTTAPRFGWYGDDFTGATDTLAVLAQAGLRSMLFMGVPSASALAAAGPLDAVGIAGAARAMAPEAMRAELAPVGRFFRQIAPTVLHYKVCSTFDSAPHVGNIACAIQTLHPSVDNRWVPILGGQPSLGRYCAFSNLFAAAGTGGAVYRIDRHPTMHRHPVTPMGEADLRLHLAQQGLQGIAALHYPLYEADTSNDAAALPTALGALLSTGPADLPFLPTLLDLTSADQLTSVGRLLWQQAQHARLLAVGPSSVAQALIACWEAHTSQSAPALAPSPAPVFAWAGSLSPITAAQVQAATSYQRIPVDAHRLENDAAYTQATQRAICAGLQQGHHVLAYTGPADGSSSPASGGASAAVAPASAALVARVVQAQVDHGTPLRRIGIAGGDTSSHAVQALQLWGLSYKTTVCPGVTLSRAHSADPSRDGLELMLKGGQMGGTDLFQRLLGAV